MSWFGQKNYTNKVGNGSYTIAEIGCFVTAFSNLLVRFGYPNETPELLNVYFTEHNVYMADPADGKRVKDDLAWGSITAYNSEITVTATGSGSWPNSDNAIVEFNYEEDGQRVTHFCLVESVANKTIIDSWDGVVKEPGQYGSPVAWASYVHKTPQSVPVANPKAKTPLSPVAPPNHTTVTTEPGWGLERIAAAAGRTDAAQIECWVAIAKANGSSDWQTFNKNLKPGQKVIVPNQGGKGEGDDTDQPVPPAPVPSVNEPSSPFTMNTYGAGSYIANRSFDVYDLSNPKMPSQPLKKGDKVVVSGSFQVMGTTYARPFVAVKTNTWMGIPFGYLDKLPVQQTVPVQKISIGDKLFIAVASIVGFVTRKKAPKL